MCPLPTILSTVAFPKQARTKKEEFLKEILLSDHYTVPGSFMLIPLLGLPDSGKSKVLEQMLKSSVVDQELPGGIPITSLGEKDGDRFWFYELIALTKPPYTNVHWVPTTKYTTYTYCLLSALQHQQSLEQESIIFDEPMKNPASFFDDEDLDKHFNEVYHRLYHFSKRRLIKWHHFEKNSEVFKSLTRGLTIVKIWDVGLNKGFMHILPLLCGHLDRSFPVIGLDLERDGSSLSKLASLNFQSEEDKVVVGNMSRSEYLIQFMRVGLSKSKKRQNVCKVLAITSSKEVEPRTDVKKKMMHDLNEEANNQDAIDLLDKEIMCIAKDDVNDKKNCLKLKEEIERFALKHASDTNAKLKISWFFLRSALIQIGSFFISFDRLKELASKCNIKENDFLTFLRVFTGSGSLIYIPEIKAFSKYVVVNPVDFFHKLNYLFYPRFNGDLCYGIVTDSSLVRMYGRGDDCDYMKCVLASCKFASQLSTSRVLYTGIIPFANVEKCFYVPTIKTSALSQEVTCENSLYLIHKQQPSAQTALHVSFVDAFFSDIQDIYLVLNKSYNVSSFLYHGAGKLTDGIKFDLIFEKRKVQVKFQQPLCCNNEEFLKMIFFSCRNAYEKANSTFEFAIPCPRQSFHYIKDDLCSDCNEQNGEFYEICKKLI